MDQWVEIKIKLDCLNGDCATKVELVQDIFLEIGALSVTLTDAEDNPILEPLPGETPLWPNVIITGLFSMPCDVGQIKSTFLLHLGTHNLHQDVLFFEDKTIENTDWVRAWMDHYHPMKFGENLWICPSHVNPPDPNAINIMLDPGLAFGTGTHPTTSLCLEWLANHQEFIKNKTVIDYGCGSGILGIAAKMLGASQCFCTDIDPQAVVATKTNAMANNVEINCVLDSEAKDFPKANLLLANILAEPLISLASSFNHYLMVGGHLVLSGLLSRDIERVKKAYEEWFIFEPHSVLDDWICLHAIKKEKDY